MVHDVAATLAQGQRAAKGIIAIDYAVHSVPELKEQLEKQIAAIEAHRKEAVTGLPLSPIFPTLEGILYGICVRGRENRSGVQYKLKALRRKIEDAGADADAAVIALQTFMREIEHSLQEYDDFKKEQTSDDKRKARNDATMMTHTTTATTHGAVHRLCIIRMIKRTRFECCTVAINSFYSTTTLAMGCTHSRDHRHVDFEMAVDKLPPYSEACAHEDPSDRGTLSSLR